MRWALTFWFYLTSSLMFFFIYLFIYFLWASLRSFKFKKGIAVWDTYLLFMLPNKASKSVFKNMIISAKVLPGHFLKNNNNTVKSVLFLSHCSFFFFCTFLFYSGTLICKQEIITHINPFNINTRQMHKIKKTCERKCESNILSFKLERSLI